MLSIICYSNTQQFRILVFICSWSNLRILERWNVIIFYKLDNNAFINFTLLLSLIKTPLQTLADMNFEFSHWLESVAYNLLRLTLTKKIIHISLWTCSGFSLSESVLLAKYFQCSLKEHLTVAKIQEVICAYSVTFMWLLWQIVWVFPGVYPSKLHEQIFLN